MKRFHVHVSVSDLAGSVRFYSALFGAGPAVLESDYAKWQLDDPRVNFAISQGRRAVGVDHLGIQAESDTELETLHSQLSSAQLATVAEQNVACCYARSNKYWTTDPSGIAWETFHSLGTAPTYGDAPPGAPEAVTAACCGPSAIESGADAPARASCCGG